MNCPEEFNLGSLTSNNWATVGKAAVAIVIVGVTILCLIMKLIFGLWLCRLNWKQNAYLDTLEKDLEEAEDQLQVRRKDACRARLVLIPMPTVWE